MGSEDFSSGSGGLAPQMVGSKPAMRVNGGWYYSCDPVWTHRQMRAGKFGHT